MKPKYDVNGYYARLWFTSDDFLKNFRWPDENIMKFRDIFIRPSILLRKVIRSDPETLKYPVNKIFRFHNILINIFDSKLIFLNCEAIHVYLYIFFLYRVLKKKHQNSEK